MPQLYDNFIDNLRRELGEDSDAYGYAQGLKGSLSTAFDKDPDKEMEIRRQAEQAGVPEEVLHNPEARKQVEIENLTDTLARRPVSQDFMSDPRNAALVMDDVEKLGEIEDESSFFGELLGAMDEVHDFLHENVTEPIVEFGEENIYDPGKAAFTQGRMVHALGKAGHELRTETDPAEKAKINQRIRELQYDMEELGVSNEGWVGFVASAAEIVGQQVSSFAQPEAFQRLSQGALAGGMVGAAAGSVVPVVGTGIGAGVGLAKGTIAGAVGHFATDAFIQESGHAYIELLEEEGIDQQAAENLAIGVGVINAGLEIAGVSMIAAPLKRSLSKYFREAATEGVKRASRTKAVRNAVRGYGIAVGGETATEIMQEATNIAAEEIGKNFFADGPVREFSFDETVDRLEEIATKTFKGMALLALPGAGVSYVSDRSKARASLRASESFSRLNKLVGDSQLARRSPEAAAQHVEKAMGIEAVQMPVARFQDMLLDMGAPAEGLLPSKRFVDTFNEASEIGGDVTIPSGNFVRALLMPENKALFEKYEQHVRWRPGQMTAAEALEFQTKGMSEAMAGRVADLAGAQQTAVEDIVVGDRLDTMQSEVRAALEDLPGAMPGMPTKVSNIVRRETEAFVEEAKAPPQVQAQTRVPSAEEITQAVQGIDGPVTPEAIAEVLAPITRGPETRQALGTAERGEGPQTRPVVEGVAEWAQTQGPETRAAVEGVAAWAGTQGPEGRAALEAVAEWAQTEGPQTRPVVEGVAEWAQTQGPETRAAVEGVAAWAETQGPEGRAALEAVAEWAQTQGPETRAAQGSATQVFHGTTHEFDQFRLDEEVAKTGEGSQTFGYGIYVTTDRRTAEYYAESAAGLRLGISEFSEEQNRAIPPIIKEELAKIAAEDIPGGDKVEKIKSSIIDPIIMGKRMTTQSDAVVETALSALEGITEESSITPAKAPQYVKEASLKHSAEHYIEWTKGVAEQPSSARAAVDAAAAEAGVTVAPDTPAREVYAAIAAELGGQRGASELLRKHGAAGIRYPVGSLSGQGDKTADNFVIFAPDELEVSSQGRPAIAGVPQEAPAQEAEQQVEPPSLEERVFNSQELAEALPSEAEAVLRAALKEQGEQVEMAVEEAKLVEEQVATRASVEPEVDPDIGTALDSLGLQALFRTAREAGMTDKQYETYQGALQKRANTAKTRKELAFAKREKRAVGKEIKAAEAKIAKNIEVELGNEPAYAVTRSPDKIDRRSLERAFGKEEAKTIIQDIRRAGGKVSNVKEAGGVDIEVMASLHDFESGDAMVTALRNTKPEKVEIQERAKAEVQKRRPDLFSKQAELGDAIMSLSHDDSSAVIAAEIEALSANRRLGRVKPAIVREIARRNLQDHTIKDIQVNKYINNARAQGLEAGKLLRKGDRKGAREAKVNQLLNMEFIKEAEARRAQVRDGHKYMSQFLKSNRQFPSMDSEFVGAIRDLLGQYSLGPKLSPNKKAELEKFVEKAQADGANFTFPERLLEDQKTNYKDMTLHDFNLLVQKVKELHHAGREVRAEDKQNRENTIAIRVDAVTNALAAKPQVETDLETRGKSKKVGKAFREMELLLLNADTVVRDLDNFEELGPVYQAIKRPIDQSTTDGYGPKTNVGLVNRQKQIAEKLLELYKVYTPTELNSISKRDIQVDGFRKPMSRNAFLSILLNSGNEQNRQAMTDSGQLTADQIQAVIDHADKRDLDFVQSVWDYLDSFWGEIEAATERRRGFKPEKVESYAMETDHGIYRGGYFPLRYDNDKGINDTRSASIEEQISQIRYGRATASHTRHDHTEERIGSGGRPVLFDMFSVHSHLDQVAYDLELGDAVNEVYATLYNPRTKKAFRDAGRAETWKALDLWLGDVVTGEMHQGGVVEKSLRWLRAGFTVSKLGWNVGVAAIQPVGILQTSVQIGKANTLAGLGLMLTRPWIGKSNIFDHVSAQSNVMAQREETFHKDIADASSLISDSYIKRHLPRGTSEFVTSSLFYGIRKTQRFVDTWTWLAAKRDGMRRFENDEARAVEYADRMVIRSQASGNFQERTAFERGSINPKVRQSELVRAFTALISYFMAKNNVAYERTKKTNFKNPGQVIGWATDMMLLYVVEAAIVGIIRGAWPDEDEAGEEYGPQVLAYLGAEGANSLFAGIPMVREFVSEAAGFRGGGVFSSVVADVAKVTDQIGQGEIDQALLTSANNLGGTLFKYPSGQINKTARALALEAEGEDVSWIEYFMGPQFDKYEK